jgi:hypothetical protein
MERPLLHMTDERRCEDKERNERKKRRARQVKR